MMPRGAGGTGRFALRLDFQAHASYHVVGHAALLVTAGIVVGVAGAAMLTRLLSKFLYGVRAIDPIAFATAGMALLALGTLPAFVPAWRAGMAR
jgi:putative ABC transport system permease protein